MDAFPHCGDLVLNGRYDPDAGVVVAFEDFVGAHGGLGGLQTDAFVLHPSGWPMPPDPVSSPETLFRVFTRWRDALLAGGDPAGGLVDAPRGDAL
jgi:hypothetical protein